MIIGIGIDVCDVERFAESVHRRPGMVDRLFTPAEAERPVASQAARFAAKEALVKALGAPPGLRWLDMEVVRGAGAPSFQLSGVAREVVERRGLGLLLSLTHDAGVAAAAVVLQERGP